MNIAKIKLVFVSCCAAVFFSAAATAQDPPPADAAPDAGIATSPAPDATAAAPEAAAPEAAAPEAAAASPEAAAEPAADATYASADASSVAEPAAPWYRSMFSDFDVSIGGFLRPEAAISTGEANPYNQTGNPYNRMDVMRTGALPPTATATTVNNVLGLLGLPLQVPLPAATTWSSVPLTVPLIGGGLLPNTSGTVRRPIPYEHSRFNLHTLRGELEVGMKFTNDLKLIGRVRAIVDPGRYKDFDAGSVNGIYGGITGGDPSLYGGKPNYFQYRVEGDNHPNPLEWAGPNYQVYFPTLLFDYNHGPLNVRLGNQQIAWGQAIFFRVLDVPDGLDLRRHSLLDYAQEEFSDKRVPALALRVGYQFSDSMLLDGYFQKFQPSVYGNPNTQYNVIPAQFTVHDLYSEGGYKNKFSYGLRFKGNFGQWGVQAIAARRYNPDGVFRWTKSGVSKSLPNNFADGSMNTLGTIVNLANGGNSGAQLANTPFEASPGGVYSAAEWFHYAAMVRLDGVEGLNASINEFQPATGNVYASPVTNVKDATSELNTFFLAGGGSLRGHIAREYFVENNFGLGASYVTEGEPGSILDQLIINLETTYTPNRVFTSPSLSRNYVRENNLVSALVLEKYHRFSQAFPATYFVMQYMHRTKDDIFGRSLSGYGGDDNGPGHGIAGGANYVVLAFQQPFPQNIYRVGFAALYDPRGGILVQPGIQWKPRGAWAIDFFYTYINGHLGGNPNNNAISTVDFADEATVRIGYQF